MNDDLTRVTDHLEREESDPTRIVIRLFSWDEEAQTPQGRERFPRGSLSWDNVTLRTQGHAGPLVGAMEDLEDRDDGPYGVFRVSDTQEGRDTLRLVQDGVLGMASVEFRPQHTSRGAGGVLVRDKAVLRRVALVDRGAYASAAPVEVREDMTDQIEGTPPVAATPYDDAALLERMDSLDQAIGRVEAIATAQPRAELDTEVRSWADVYAMVQEDPEANEILARALADNTLAANTGLQGTANIARIVEPVAAKRRTINAFGLGGLPPVGLTVDYTRMDTAASTGYQALVGAQAAEKDEISTGTHVWVPDSAAIQTFAGGADNSWQLLQRSSPDFRTRLLAQYSSEFSLRSNAAMVAAVVAGGTADTLTLGADTTALIAKLIDQSVAIEALVDRPMNVCLMSSDLWAAVAKLPDMMDPANPVQNVSGTVNAGSLDMRLQGLSLVHEPALPVATMVTSVGGGEAAEYREDFKGIVTQDQISRLGTDIAVWGLGAQLIYVPGAVFVTTVTLPVAAGQSGKGK